MTATSPHPQLPCWMRHVGSIIVCQHKVCPTLLNSVGGARRWAEPVRQWTNPGCCSVSSIPPSMGLACVAHARINMGGARTLSVTARRQTLPDTTITANCVPIPSRSDFTRSRPGTEGPARYHKLYESDKGGGTRRCMGGSRLSLALWDRLTG